MLKTIRLKHCKLYLLHLLWSVRILFEHTTYIYKTNIDVYI